MLINFFRKKRFYDEVINNLEQLDKKYLILETVNMPEFYEGELMYQFLYEINKSMLERIGEYEFSINDFKDYVIGGRDCSADCYNGNAADDK